MPSPGSISRLTSELVVTRTVRDTAAVLDATHGHVAADLFQLAPPSRPYQQELGVEPGRLRVALLVEGGGFDVDGECAIGAQRAAATLAEMGHYVEPVGPEMLFGGELGAVNGKLWMAALARRVDEISEQIGRPVTASEVEGYNWTAAVRGRSMPAHEWVALQERQQAWVQLVTEWLSGYDILVTPTSGCPPMTTASMEPPAERPWRIGRTYGRIGRFTLPFNATGHPAISLPLHWTPDGLPVGVQIVGPMGREDLLLRLAARFEEAMPWADRWPRVHA
jgi:amidase